MLSAGSLFKRGKLEAKLKTEKMKKQSKAGKGRGKLMSSSSTMSIFGRNGMEAAAMARHSFAGLEQLTARLNTLGGKDGHISRHPSNVSDGAVVSTGKWGAR